MTPLQVLVLAVLQGLTEFLPISSSAHLVLVSRVTGWADQGLAFDAAIHLGTLVAVTAHFRGEVRQVFRGLTSGAEAADRRLAGALAIATLPVLVIGFLAAGWIEAHLRDPLLIAGTTMGFALVLLAADRLGRGDRGVDAVGWRLGLMLGLAQVLALVPGTSRSGITITAALAAGLNRESAARFSFLMSIPVIAAAGGWGLVQALRDGESLQLAVFLSAAAISGIVAWLTVAAFLAWVRRHGMLPFVIYRLVLGVLLLVWFWPAPG